VEFLAGLLPGVLVGVVIGLVGTVVARHSRPVLKALVKVGLLLGDGLRIVLRAIRARLDELVVEARADLAKPKAAKAPGPRGEHGPPPPRRFDGPLM